MMARQIRTFRAIGLMALCNVLAGAYFAAEARPLSADEQRVLRAAPPIAEQNQTPEHLKRYRDATDLARKLGADGNLDALVLLIKMRQLNVLNEYVGMYKNDATSELEAIALRHLGDPDVGPRVAALLRRVRSQALFDALMDALQAGKVDCDYLLRAIQTAEVPDVEPRLAKLLPVIHPNPGQYIAARFAERQYLAGERALLDLFGRTKLDTRFTVAALATHITRLPSDATLNAAARKLIEIAKMPEDQSPPKLGLIFSIRNEDIPRDNLQCSTEALRIPHPLLDARGRQVRELVRIISIAPPDATLDASLFTPSVLEAFTAEEHKSVQAMLQERVRVQALYREVTPDNFLHWIGGLDPRLVKAFINRGADVNAPGRFGLRPLVHAAGQLRPEAVQMLLDAGANPNLANTDEREGYTALQAVSAHQATQPILVAAGERIMKLLLARGADPRTRTKRGATALQFAAGQHLQLATLLIAAGADVRAADAQGTTPLHVAAHAGNHAVARLLLDRGTDVNAEEKGGVTPLLIAQDNKNKELERLFASRGGRINHAYYLKREAVIRLYQLQRGQGH